MGRARERRSHANRTLARKCPRSEGHFSCVIPALASALSAQKPLSQLVASQPLRLRPLGRPSNGIRQAGRPTSWRLVGARARILIGYTNGAHLAPASPSKLAHRVALMPATTGSPTNQLTVASCAKCVSSWLRQTRVPTTGARLLGRPATRLARLGPTVVLTHSSPTISFYLPRSLPRTTPARLQCSAVARGDIEPGRLKNGPTSTRLAHSSLPRAAN